MNRTDRLYAIVEELRAAAPRSVRAGQLAARFEVSARTIERDVSALQQTGVPIWASPGPAGGYRIDPATTLAALNFTPEEATAMAVALAASPELPFAVAGRSALRKVLAAMPPKRAEAARALAERVAVAVGPAEPAVPAAVSRAIEQAVVEHRVLRIDYRDVAGQTSRRLVEPLALVSRPDATYLVAWCRSRVDFRTFRLDRIVTARLLRERTDRAMGLSLGRPPTGGVATTVAAAALFSPDGEIGLSREQLLAVLEDGYRVWRRTVAVAVAAATDAPAVCGEWSAKDLVNHVTAYQRWQVAQMMAITTGRAPTRREENGPRWYPDGDPGFDVEPRNKLITEAGRHLSLEALAEEGDDIHGRVTTWVRRCPRRDLRRPIGVVRYWEPSFAGDPDRRLIRFADGPDAARLARHQPLWAYVARLYLHAAEHARHLAAAYPQSDDENRGASP